MLRMTRATLHLVLSAFAVSNCFEEIPSPDLARGAKQFQPWINPGPPYTDHHLISRGENLDAANLVTQRSDLRLDNTPQTLQQKLRFERKFGFGIEFVVVKNSSPPSPSIARPAREVQPSNTTEDSDLSPVSVTVSDNAPPASLLPADEKCQFVQQMNISQGEECTKGGMRCERKCQQKTEDPVCKDEFQVPDLILLALFYVMFLGCMWRCARRCMWYCEWEILQNCTTRGLWWCCRQYKNEVSKIQDLHVTVIFG